MASGPRGVVSRRTALAGFAAAAVASVSASAAPAPGDATTENTAGPVFSLSGPNAELHGAAEGFPIADRALPVQPGEPHQLKYRVGAYVDEIYPTHRIKRAAAPWLFKRSQADIRYDVRGNRSSVSDYLPRNPVTGLLIAKDDQILCEYYQYGRTDRDRLMSQSCPKATGTTSQCSPTSRTWHAASWKPPATFGTSIRRKSSTTAEARSSTAGLPFISSGSSRREDTSASAASPST
jgi:hypothetical protein